MPRQWPSPSYAPRIGAGRPPLAEVLPERPPQGGRSPDRVRLEARRGGAVARRDRRRSPNVKRGRCRHQPRLRFRPGCFHPGRFPIEFCRSKLRQGSIRDDRSKLRTVPSDLARQAPLPSCGRLSGKPATIRWASIRQAGDFPVGVLRQAGDLPADILPASRRLSVCGPLSTGRTRLGDRPFLSGRTLPVPSGLPSSKLSGRPFAVPSPEGDGPPDSGKVGSAWGFPAASRFFPAAPPERPWSPSRRISTLSALAAFRSSFPFPVGPS